MATESRPKPLKADKRDSRHPVSVNTASPPLPEDLRGLFWDVEFRRLRWPRHRDFVIGRVLAEGDFQQTRWLVGTIGRDGIREWIVGRRGRGLSPRVLRFWEAVLDLPHRQVSRWIAEQAAFPWTNRRSP